MSEQAALPLAEAFPRYWIARRCTHWTPAHNRRFRIYRLDGPQDHVGRYPGHVWDADRREWKSQHVFGGIAGHELDRPATARDLKGVVLSPNSLDAA